MEPYIENILHLYDLPKEDITIIQIAKIIKQKAQYDIKEMPIIKRNANKPFYTAMVKINDTQRKFDQIAKAMKYFEINGKQCRALPQYKEFTIQNIEKCTLFVKNLWKTMTSKKLEDIFGQMLIDASVTSAKISIKPDHTSRGYGFICFKTPEHAESALKKSNQFEQQFKFKVCSYQKDKSEQIKTFGAIQIKNFPRSWTKQSIEKIFGQYGNIKNTVLISETGLITEKDPVVAFAFYDDSLNNQQGYTCAQNALQSEKGKVYDGIKLLVKLTNSQECLELIEKNKEYNLAQKNNRIALENLKKHTTEIQYGYNQLQNKNPKMIDMLNRPETFQLLQYLMITIQRQQQNQRYNNPQRQGGNMQQRGPRQQYNNNQGGYQQRNQQIPQGQMPPMNQPMRQPLQPVMMSPLGMPLAQVASAMNQNLPPHILTYNQNGMAKILPLVSNLNSNYKSQVGEYIYEHVETLAGEDLAPKITGMLIDLPIAEIQAYITNFMKLQIKINEAYTLLKWQNQNIHSDYQQENQQVIPGPNNLSPLSYNQTGMTKILPLVNASNPNYKSQVGEYIMEHIVQLTSESSYQYQ
eukprot:403366140